MLALSWITGAGAALAQAAAFDLDPAKGPQEGSTWHFVKSNRDGSKPWQLVMHVVSSQQIEVIKVSGTGSYVEVHALLDLANAQPTHLQQWNLRCGERVPTNTVIVRPMPAGGTRVELRTGAGATRTFEAGASAHVWGFDLTGFALLSPRLRRPQALQLSLVDLNQPLADGGFRQAVLNIVPDGSEPIEGQPAQRFRLESALFDGKQGSVWLSAEGELLKAEHELRTSRDWQDWRLERVRSEGLQRGDWERFKLDWQRRTASVQQSRSECRRASTPANE